MNEFLILSLWEEKETFNSRGSMHEYINILTIDFILAFQTGSHDEVKMTWKLQILLPQPLNTGYKHESVWLNE